MKPVKLFFSIALCLTTSATYSAEKEFLSVNAIIGDLSFVHTFKQRPSEKTPEALRIKTHLEYVEELLRNKRTSHLTPIQKSNRKHMLDLLHGYWNAEIFPSNYDYAGTRIPCFIDRENRICAVGYLIEQTAGRDVAQEINAKFQYSNLMDMHDPLVDNWIAASGLTKLECAMIQPTYDWRPYPNDPVSPPIATTPVIFLVDNSKELKLQAEVDSQHVVIETLHAEVDSVNLLCEKAKNTIDTLQTQMVQKDAEIHHLQKGAKTNTVVICILGSMLGAGLVLGTTVWLKRGKPAL